MKEKEQNTHDEDDNKSIPIERVPKGGAKTEEPVAEPGIKNTELIDAVNRAAELEKQLAELKDTMLRKAADFENFKRRNENDQLNLFKYAAEPFIKSVLPIYDDLERSLSHIDDANNFESTKKGLMLVFEKFGKVLEAQGVTRIDAKGKPFDVSLHEALMQQPAAGVEPHTVLEVIEQGYLYKDKVLRHSKVVVSAETASHEEESRERKSDEN